MAGDDEIIYTDMTSYWNPFEVWAVAMCTLVLSLQFLVALYMVIHRDWKPFKAKQPWSLFLGASAAIISFVAELHSQILIPNDYPVLSACALWRQWFFVTFGMGLISACLLYRLFMRWIVLDFLSSRFAATHRKIDRTFIQILGVGVIYVPMLVLSIVNSTAGETSLGPLVLANGQVIQVCYTRTKVLNYSLNCFIGIYCAAMALWWTHALRDVRRSFNEFRAGRPALIFAVCCLLSYLALLFVIDSSKYYYRAVFLLLNTGITSPIFCAVVFDVITSWFVRRQEEEDVFEAGLAMTMLTHAPRRGRRGNTYDERNHPGSKASTHASGDSGRNTPKATTVEYTEYNVELEEEMDDEQVVVGVEEFVPTGMQSPAPNSVVAQPNPGAPPAADSPPETS